MEQEPATFIAAAAERENWTDGDRTNWSGLGVAILDGHRVESLAIEHGELHARSRNLTSVVTLALDESEPKPTEDALKRLVLELARRLVARQQEVMEALERTGAEVEVHLQMLEPPRVNVRWSEHEELRYVGETVLDALLQAERHWHRHHPSGATTNTPCTSESSS